MIVNAVGMDRPGIVSDVTKFVTDAGGNVGQSQAAKLGDYFSIMMQIDVPKEEVDDLKKSLTTLPGLNASVFETPAESTATARPRVACKYDSVVLGFIINLVYKNHSRFFSRCALIRFGSI